MAETFSERYGHAPVRTALQQNEMDRVLRVKIWDNIYAKIHRLDAYDARTSSSPALVELWVWHFNDPIDTIPERAQDVVGRMRRVVFEGSFNEVYDLVEAFARRMHSNAADVYDNFNAVFARYLAPYRFVGGKILRVDADTDVTAIEDALIATEGFAGVRHHLDSSLSLLADRDNPHYANSIKESISAVEACVKFITGQKKASLGDAVKAIKGAGIDIPKSLENGWSSLYGFTSSAQGIRHSASEKPNLTQADAKYWLVTCSAFVSLLLSQALAAGLVSAGVAAQVADAPDADRETV